LPDVSSITILPLILPRQVVSVIFFILNFAVKPPDVRASVCATKSTSNSSATNSYNVCGFGCTYALNRLDVI